MFVSATNIGCAVIPDSKMSSSPSKKSKVKFSSSFNIEAESLHQRVVDTRTGEYKEVRITEPQKFETKTSVTGNPVTYEEKGLLDEPRASPPIVKEEKVEVPRPTRQPEKVERVEGYDASQL